MIRHENQLSHPKYTNSSIGQVDKYFDMRTETFSKCFTHSIETSISYTWIVILTESIIIELLHLYHYIMIDHLWFVTLSNIITKKKLDESIHCKRFIPGSKANALFRWNYFLALTQRMKFFRPVFSFDPVHNERCLHVLIRQFIFYFFQEVILFSWKETSLWLDLSLLKMLLFSLWNYWFIFTKKAEKVRGREKEKEKDFS